MSNHQEKLSLLQDLIALSKADGNEANIEHQFISSIAKGLDVSETDLNDLKNNPVKYTPENKETDRIIQFYRLLLLMGSDKVRTDAEIEFCKEAGLKMGLNTTGIETTIKKIAASKTGMLPPNEVINIFKVNHN